MTILLLFFYFMGHPKNKYLLMGIEEWQKGSNQSSDLLRVLCGDVDNLTSKTESVVSLNFQHKINISISTELKSFEIYIKLYNTRYFFSRIRAW